MPSWGGSRRDSRPGAASQAHQTIKSLSFCSSMAAKVNRNLGQSSAPGKTVKPIGGGGSDCGGIIEGDCIVGVS